jgi:hypothetical protein
LVVIEVAFQNSMRPALIGPGNSGYTSCYQEVKLGLKALFRHKEA